MWDVAIAGAGMTGLTCAVALQQAGYRVVVIEKSKGVGGRVATRRLEQGWVDHGALTLARDPQDEAQYGAYLNMLMAQNLIQPWPQHKIYRACPDQGQWRLGPFQPLDPTLYYVAPAGITAIAKALTDDLDICRAQRVVNLALDPQQSYWQLSTEPAVESEQQPMTIRAKAVVLAIPAPQAIDLCLPLAELGLDPTLLEALQTVQFAPCLSVIAEYTASQNLPWSEIYCEDDPVVQRIICDSHKRPGDAGSVFVIQSTPIYAAQYLDAPDLMDAGQQMLEHLGQVYAPWMAQPDRLQVHRWRYAIATDGYPGQPLSANFDLPLWVCGDWCVGSTIQNAFEVGLEVAQHLQYQLDSLQTLP